ncbi:hypothetical protein B0H11DRAFT_2293800 [Mycena galericulata]|nr:hypothetical protein B0H11DRAFT_2293800 [Mycena galericulata]
MSGFRFLSRGKPKLPPIKPKPPHPRTPCAFPDALRTALFALKESAAAFPPLESAVGGVIALCNIAERSKHSKSEAHDIALRTKEILDVVADAVPDVTKIHPDMRTSIERFTVLLDDIRYRMEAVALTGRVSRLVHLNRNERMLRDIKSQLDEAYQDFSVAVALRIEVQQMNLVFQQEKIQVDVANVAAATTALAPDLSKVLLYSKLIVFLAGP